MKGQDVDLIRQETLNANLDAAKKKVPEAVQQTYNIVVTVSNGNEVQAFKLSLDATRPLFDQIKSDARCRIQETAVSYEALLPDGPYDLWRSGETSRRVKDLVGAFAQFPHLPKMLNRQAILDTLVEGCREGQFVLRATRPDRSTRTVWRHQPDEGDLKNTTLEVVLPESAELSQLEPSLLAPGKLPELWKETDFAVADARAYFSGGKVIKIARQGYDEPVTIPKAPRAVVDDAIGRSVKEGKLWLTHGPTSLLSEEIPAGLLSDEARLQSPPTPIPATDVLAANLPDAWISGTATALAITDAAHPVKAGKPLPWETIRTAIDGDCQGRYLERTEDSGPWPCDYSGAAKVLLKPRSTSPASEVPAPAATPPPPPPGVLVASAYLKPGEIQDFADQIGEVGNTAVGYDLKVLVRIEVGSERERPPEDVVTKLKKMLTSISPSLKLE